MDNIKFSPEQPVRFKPQAAGGISMKRTEVVGFQDVSENLWEKRYCEIAKTHKPRRVEEGSGTMENRYVIAHYYGWPPSNQQGLDEDLDLNINRRYQFAYESELTDISE